MPKPFRRTGKGRGKSGLVAVVAFGAVLAVVPLAVGGMGLEGDDVGGQVSLQAASDGACPSEEGLTLVRREGFDLPLHL